MATVKMLDTVIKSKVVAMAALTGSVVCLSLLYNYAFKWFRETSDHLDNEDSGLSSKFCSRGDVNTDRLTHFSTDTEEARIHATIDELACADNERVVELLRHVANRAAFSSYQELFRVHGGLVELLWILKRDDHDVQTHAALAINNLAMNVENQAILMPAISELVAMLRIADCKPSALRIAASKALTNLTTLEEGQQAVLLRVNVFTECLKCVDLESELQIQLLKLVVNLTINPPITELNTSNLKEVLVAVIDVIRCPSCNDDTALRGLYIIRNICTAFRHEPCFKSLCSLVFEDKAFYGTLNEMSLRDVDDDVRAQARAVLSFQASQPKQTLVRDLSILAHSFSKLTLGDSGN